MGEDIFVEPGIVARYGDVPGFHWRASGHAAPDGASSTRLGVSHKVHHMTSSISLQSPAWPLMAWLVAAVAGIAAPAIAMLLLQNTPATAPLALMAGPVLAVGLMGAGMISAAIAGRLWIGIALALLTASGLILFALSLGMPPLEQPVAVGLAVIIACTSFAARGTLFARSAAEKGWWIAVAVVAGEAAIVATAAAMPSALPGWLLALLPAQWASMAIQSALTVSATPAAIASLIALSGTAAATLLVVRLWPRRWPYLIMFTTWLGLSALVWHQSGA